MAVREHFLINIDCRRLCRCAGATLRHCVQEIKALHAANQIDRADSYDCRPQKRQNDMPNLLPFAAAVKRCRLQQFLWHSLQRSRKDHHAKTGPLPKCRDKGCKKRGIVISKQVKRLIARQQSKYLQDLIDYADQRVINQRPQTTATNDIIIGIKNMVRKTA